MGDGCRLNRTAYVELVDGNLAWLARQEPTLERSHIETIVVWSVARMYPAPKPGEHDWTKSHGPRAERCSRCLMTREMAGAYWQYFTAYERCLGARSPAPPCAPEAHPSGGAP